MAAAAVSTSWILLAVLLCCCPVDAGWTRNKRPKPRKEDFIELEFYLHDDLLVPNATAYFVVPPREGGIPSTFLGHNFFGGIVVIDDLLTVGPDPHSLEVGRAKGLYVWDNIAPGDPGLEFIFTVFFTEGSGFDGSTISFRGFDLLRLPRREISISGGTDKFRLARGWANFSVYFADEFQAILHFKAFVFYGGY